MTSMELRDFSYQEIKDLIAEDPATWLKLGAICRQHTTAADVKEFVDKIPGLSDPDVRDLAQQLAGNTSVGEYCQIEPDTDPVLNAIEATVLHPTHGDREYGPAWRFRTSIAVAQVATAGELLAEPQPAADPEPHTIAA